MARISQEKALYEDFVINRTLQFIMFDYMNLLMSQQPPLEAVA
jgi:hypothetical protein